MILNLKPATNLLVLISTILVLIFSSCSKDCSQCRVVVDSDRKKQCGLANNGWDVEETQQLGELCDEEKDAAMKKHNKTITTTAFCGSQTVTYTLRARVLCN